MLNEKLIVRKLFFRRLKWFVEDASHKEKEWNPLLIIVLSILINSKSINYIMHSQRWNNKTQELIKRQQQYSYPTMDAMSMKTKCKKIK